MKISFLLVFLILHLNLQYSNGQMLWPWQQPGEPFYAPTFMEMVNKLSGQTTLATTTEDPRYTQPTTENAFQEAGWETDDDGNVYVGKDNNKLYLISVGSYWPFPKDYKKKK